MRGAVEQRVLGLAHRRQPVKPRRVNLHVAGRAGEPSAALSQQIVDAACPQGLHDALPDVREDRMN